MVHPVLCTKALRALLDILQGQQPEGLKSEPNEVIGKTNEAKPKLLKSKKNTILHQILYSICFWISLPPTAPKQFWMKTFSSLPWPAVA